MEPRDYHHICHRPSDFLPGDFKNLRQIADLLVRDCRATAIPPEVSALQHLTFLRIYECDLLKTLPTELSLLPLNRICVNNCPNFLALPENIGCIRTLESLEISQCKLFARLPDGIGELSRLQSLVILSRHFLPTCFSLVPDSIGRLQNLQSLMITHSPALRCLPRSLVLLPKLAVLDLSGCYNFVFRAWVVFFNEDLQFACDPQAWSVFLDEDLNTVCSSILDPKRHCRDLRPKLSACRMLTLLVATRRRRQHSLPTELWELIYHDFLSDGLFICNP